MGGYIVAPIFPSQSNDGRIARFPAIFALHVSFVRSVRVDAQNPQIGCTHESAVKASSLPDLLQRALRRPLLTVSVSPDPPRSRALMRASLICTGGAARNQQHCFRQVSSKIVLKDRIRRGFVALHRLQNKTIHVPESISKRGLRFTLSRTLTFIFVRQRHCESKKVPPFEEAGLRTLWKAYSGRITHKSLMRSRRWCAASSR
jgi:hypothetical protein